MASETPFRSQLIRLTELAQGTQALPRGTEFERLREGRRRLQQEGFRYPYQYLQRLRRLQRPEKASGLEYDRAEKPGAKHGDATQNAAWEQTQKKKKQTTKRLAQEAVPKKRATQKARHVRFEPEPVLRNISRQDSSWKPSMVIGETGDANTSRIEAAERNIDRWRAICEWHREHLPDALPHVQRSLEIAIEEREKLEPSQENNAPIAALQSHAEARLVERLGILERALSTSAFPLEAANITAALAGYRTGAIPYSTYFTLIYAGRIVDTAPTYASFCADRADRLDRYAAARGPGWLWWEPPLVPAPATPDGGDTVLAKKGMALSLECSNAFSAGHYYVSMGYRRRREFVSRGMLGEMRRAADEAKAAAAGDARRLASFARKKTRRAPARHEDWVGPGTTSTSTGTSRGSGLGAAGGEAADDDPSAPLLFFKMLLDTGASVPMLYRPDLDALGIDRKQYAAQTACKVEFASGGGEGRLYEMYAGVWQTTTTTTTTYTHTSLVPDQPTPVSSAAATADAAVYPTEPRVLGAMTPVYALEATRAPAAAAVSNRLSGMLPFHACYLSSAPGQGVLWLGEDRRDVLGAARLPGQLRWDPWADGAQAPTRHPRAEWAGLHTPTMLLFGHGTAGEGEGKGEGGVAKVLVDAEDGRRGRSVTAVWDRDGRERRWSIEPRRQWAGEGGRQGEKEGEGEGVVEQAAAVGEKERQDSLRRLRRLSRMQRSFAR